MENSKDCCKCGLTKPLSQFYKTGTTDIAVRADCKECVKAYRIQHRKDNPEIYKEIEARRKAKWSEDNPERCRNSRLKYTYGIDQGEYERILQSQGGVCAICSNPESKIVKATGKTKRLAVDHCHTTGRVRGLLCFDCNSSLGKFKDDIRILESAIEYLKQSQRGNHGPQE